MINLQMAEFVRSAAKREDFPRDRSYFPGVPTWESLR